MRLKYRTRSSVHRKRTRTELTALFLQTTKRKKSEATVSRLGLEDQKFSTIVWVYVCTSVVVCSKKLAVTHLRRSVLTESPNRIKKGKPTGQYRPLAVQRRMRQQCGGGNERVYTWERLVTTSAGGGLPRGTTLTVKFNIARKRRTCQRLEGWFILCLHALEPKCKALSPAWRDSDKSRNMYMLLPCDHS
ncbi:hypothetical protein T05_40 [Trichinella murrelli]|uniref:Uncharacterized protein n=1 Tax=Trichinella murrelli TaxID=144512 RepID=A0A0V0T9X5_9BILA|nr:hypothetical protein T05_40 [Trichinella murrelli]